MESSSSSTPTPPTTGYARGGTGATAGRSGSTTAASPAASLALVMDHHDNPNSRQRKRRRIIGVSTKMYFSAARTDSFIRAVVDQLLLFDNDSEDGIDIFVVPDFVSLVSAAQVIRESGFEKKIIVGAQDCHSEDFGAYTGEVSPRVLREVGCGIVELGHAERKTLFGETEADVRRKVKAVVRNGMVPLVCVGELTREEGMEGAGREVLRQVEVVLGGILAEEKEGGDEGAAPEVVLAYEPVWAIGAEEPAGAEYVRGVVRMVREEVGRRMGEKIKVRIIYGGSAGPGLWEKLGGEVDGLFLGRFAHDPEQFVRTVIEVAGVGSLQRPA
ncbi:putative Triosephosphate isomerase [Cladorrhinum sp. PSN259]|nr:putative Triosephosphate isomerase [Cladorrhinum sp. PSN259]